MRRDIAAFLIGGSILVLALEARPVAACFAHGLSGPYQGSPKESPDQELTHHGAETRGAETRGAETRMDQEVLVTQRVPAPAISPVVVRPAPLTGF